MVGGMPRQGILSLSIKDKQALYQSYMPYLKHGGLFVPTNKQYKLGDEVFILLTLMEDNERIPIAGQVVWITPVGSQGNLPCGPARLGEGHPYDVGRRPPGVCKPAPLSSRRNQQTEVSKPPPPSPPPNLPVRRSP